MNPRLTKLKPSLTTLDLETQLEIHSAIQANRLVTKTPNRKKATVRKKSKANLTKAKVSIDKLSLEDLEKLEQLLEGWKDEK